MRTRVPEVGIKSRGKQLQPTTVYMYVVCDYLSLSLLSVSGTQAQAFSIALSARVFEGTWAISDVWQG